MANFGVGVGAFMDGLTRGIGTARALQRDKRDAELHDLRKGELEFNQQERTRERGIRQENEAAAQSAYSSALKARGLEIDKYLSQGRTLGQAEQLAGTVYDRMVNTGLPKMLEPYLKRGDLAGATAIQEWADSASTKRGMRSLAGLVAATAPDEIDFDSAARHAKDLYNNHAYSSTDDELVKVERAGSGIALRFRGADGRERRQTFSNPRQVIESAIGMAVPEKAFEMYLQRQQMTGKAQAGAAQDERRHNFDLSRDQAKHQQSLAQIGARGAEDRRTVAARGTIDSRTAAPAEVRTAEWLVANGAAPDASSAWEMVRGARTKPREQFILETSRMLLSNQDPMAFGDARMTPQQAVRQAEQIFDSMRGTEAGAGPQQQAGGREVVRRGIHKGRPVVQYADGSIDYAD